MFSKRLIQPEILDSAPPHIARRNLSDLVRINSYFGGHSTTRKLLASGLDSREPFTLLDVGAASGDTGRLIAKIYPRAQVTSLDYNAVNLELASQPKVIADAFQLPFAPDTYDYVFSSLFLHHFEDEQVIQLLRSMYSVARRAVFIVDLERHVLPYIFLPLSRPLFHWGEITVHDGVRSVRAAFTKQELKSLALAAGIEDPSVMSHRPAFRLTLLGKIAQKKAQIGVAETAPGR